MNADIAVFLSLNSPQNADSSDYHSHVTQKALNALDQSLKIDSIEVYLSVIRHIHSIYTQTYHHSGQLLIPRILNAYHNIISKDVSGLHPVLAEIYDCLYFLYWYTNTAIADGLSFDREVVRPLSDYVIRYPLAHRVSSSPTRFKKKVLILAQFFTLGDINPVGQVSMQLAHTLNTYLSNVFKPTLVAWQFVDNAMIDACAARSLRLLCVESSSYAQRVEKLNHIIQREKPDIIVSDMNTSIPTMFFESRVASNQIYYQCGMPYWNLRRIDTILATWSGSKTVFTGQVPFYELVTPFQSYVRPTPDKELLQSKRSELAREDEIIIGCYARLIKITESYISAAASILSSCPKAKLVIAGTGDSSLLIRLLETHGITARTCIVNEFVDPAYWRHMYDVFMDTFPLTGGSSCREVLDSGTPVVSLYSSDLANITSKERRLLVAHTLEEYTDIVRHLVDSSSYRALVSKQTRLFVSLLKIRSKFSYNLQLTQALSNLDYPHKPHSVANRLFRAHLAMALVSARLKTILWRHAANLYFGIAAKLQFE